MGVKKPPWKEAAEPYYFVRPGFTLVASPITFVGNLEESFVSSSIIVFKISLITIMIRYALAKKYVTKNIHPTNNHLVYSSVHSINRFIIVEPIATMNPLPTDCEKYERSSSVALLSLIRLRTLLPATAANTDIIAPKKPISIELILITEDKMSLNCLMLDRFQPAKRVIIAVIIANTIGQYFSTLRFEGSHWLLAIPITSYAKIFSSIITFSLKFSSSNGNIRLWVIGHSLL